ncbi:hypothetical protein [Pseudomonas sp. KK4]|uniref:hypothetical protein n=1 Tax=Pseudomonas sp. KK4 TaxID=1855729 RepID=UPI00097BC18C|nr:hypothetical protein [Pseudomonas sp. KK4]
MDSHEIEDTDDWLGSPTPLETCRHSLRVYENEVQELTLQLRQARQKIYQLVEMHTEAAKERDTLRTQLAAAKAETAEANRRATDIETKTNWQLMAQNKHISELAGKLEKATGKHHRTDRPLN